ncbi:tetratricopeptide repeat protein [soil metagenome]
MVNTQEFSTIFILLIAFTALFHGNKAFAQKGKKGKTSERELTESERIRSEEYFTEGKKYFILEDYPKALALFQKSLEIDPDNATIYYNIAEVLVKNNELAKALPYSSKAVELSPENKYFHLLKAEIYTKQAEFQNAAQVFEEMISIIPNSEEYYYDLAALYLYQEKFEEALAIYDKAEEEFGINDEVTFQKQKIYLKTNNLEAAIKEGEKLIEYFPGESHYIIALSEILMSNNKYKEAETYLKELLEFDPGNSSAQYLMFEVYRQSGQKELAEENLKLVFENPELDINTKLPLMVEYIQRINDDKSKDTALDLAERIAKAHPYDANSFAIFGDLNFAMGDKAEARDKYLEAVKLDESNFNVWQNIVDIELQLGNYDNVIKLADQAIELFPNQPTLYFFHGSANLVKKDYDEAVFSLEHGKKLASANPDLLGIFHSQLGDAYNGLEDYAKSEAAYEAALEMNPDNYYVLNNYSYFLSLRKEKLDLAKKMSTKLVKNNPDNSTYLDTHAWVLYMLKEYKEARKYLEKAIQGEPSGTIIEHYGDVLFQLGETDKAVLQWQKAKGLNDSSEIIEKKIADRKLYE